VPGVGKCSMPQHKQTREPNVGDVWLYDNPPNYSYRIVDKRLKAGVLQVHLMALDRPNKGADGWYGWPAGETCWVLVEAVNSICGNCEEEAPLDDYLCESCRRSLSLT
jgi:hypothetical protein